VPVFKEVYAHPGGVMEADSDFDEFVRLRADALLRLAYLLVGDRGRAEDTVQDVLERMYPRWDRIRDAPEAYARRAVVNATANQRRWRRRHRETALSEAVEPLAEDHAGWVSGRQAILVALTGLSRQQRAAVVLRYLNELSIEEVADILGCTTGAVKSHTARGLAKLRAALSDSSERNPI
jgi:RNA polymerase sigma-70 factor (sigma-E family)